MKKIPFEYRITSVYIFIGALWILFSDKLALSLVNDARQIEIISISKGWFYVLITGILLFILVRKEIKRRNIIYNDLLKAKRKAEESDNLKSAFLSNISHFIRTPMNGILGFVDLIKNKNLTPEKNEQFLNIINDRSQSLLNTINSIISISQIHAGQYDIVKTKFSLNTVLNKIAISIEPEINNKKLPVVVKTTFAIAGDNDMVLSDKEIITQIITNLVKNSVNFTSEGEIEISYKLSGNNYFIYVRDTGCGISTEKQRTILTDFMFGQDHNFVVGEGAGISLHLSARLAKLIGGELLLKSTSDKGTVFCLRLPTAV